eukprot:TRINITY_DN78_c0_g2_i3.p1 TRINITY_DN78_c0_g2~~TRINITY_DN78_c0_g2_i3.p1  ORF type:complete len:774 (-),score=272.34 TRINITY_DN78_c0_g2_i3:111-2189(-)
MTAKELEENLGTVARSGTAQFLDAFSKKKDDEDSASNDAMSLIGQFGVGFYSSFLVADEVTVISKSPEDGSQNIWKSTADGSFTVSTDPRGVTLGRGTSVVLTLKEDASEFLDNSELERVVKRYSQFLQYPIKLWSSRTETVELPPEPKEEEDEEETEGEDEDDDELVAEDEDDEDEDDEPEVRTEERTVYFWKQLNDQKPVWTRRPSQVDEEEYESFYKSFTKASDSYLAKSHFRAEGEIEFDSILFVPRSAPWGLYDNYYTQKSSLALYVRRVLVADKFEDFIPRYLNFMKGLVDSNDLPLNVNREQLQKNKIMKVISKKVTRKALDMLRKLAEAEEGGGDEDEDDDEEAEDKPEDEAEGDDDDEAESEAGPSEYSKFYKEFGRSIKLGVIEDTKNRKKLVDLLRFTSIKHPETPISLSAYVEEMPEAQKNILYMSAASQTEAASSPFLERATSKGFDVLFFVENLDEYLNLNDYEDFTLQSVTKEGLDLGDGKGGDAYKEEKKEEFQELVDWLKDLYDSKVNKVEISLRLESSPLVIVTTKYGSTANMERITKGQAFGRSGGKATKVVEINPRHPVMVALKDKVVADKESQELKDYANVLFDMALIQSGFSIEEDQIETYAKRLERVVREGLAVSADAAVEPMPEFPDEEEEDEDEDEDDEDEEEELEDEEEEAAEEETEEAAEEKDEL